LLRNALKFLALSLVIVALASPITTKEIILDNSKGYEISLILDASGSMQFFLLAKKQTSEYSNNECQYIGIFKTKHKETP
jgi:hypothetical protein